MYKSFIRKITDKFLFLKKAEENYFPIALKEIEIPEQQSNFDKIKVLLKKSSNQEAIIDTAVERQMEEHLFFTKILLSKSTEEKTNQIDIEIFNTVVESVFILSTSKDYEQKVDILFKLYVASARYVERNKLFNLNERPIDSVGRSYAMRGIYSGFSMFIDSVQKIEYQKQVD